jgi:hypothetical protein
MNLSPESSLNLQEGRPKKVNPKTQRCQSAKESPEIPAFPSALNGCQLAAKAGARNDRIMSDVRGQGSIQPIPATRYLQQRLLYFACINNESAPPVTFLSLGSHFSVLAPSLVQIAAPHCSLTLHSSPFRHCSGRYYPLLFQELKAKTMNRINGLVKLGRQFCCIFSNNSEDNRPR